MCVVLFARSGYNLGMPYWQQVQLNINWMPFHSIYGYVYALIHKTNLQLVPYALINLFGNVAAFIPLGFYLPRLWGKCRSLGRFFAYATTIIVLIELIQLFSLRGSCDVDDLILNVSGALMGFALFRLTERG